MNFPFGQLRYYERLSRRPQQRSLARVGLCSAYWSPTIFDAAQRCPLFVCSAGLALVHNRLPCLRGDTVTRPAHAAFRAPELRVPRTNKL